MAGRGFGGGKGKGGGKGGGKGSKRIKGGKGGGKARQATNITGGCTKLRPQGHAAPSDPGGMKGSGKITGTVKRWNRDRGFGFIIPDTGSDDIFCHFSNITDGNALEVGSKVTYDESFEERKGKACANNDAGGYTMSSGGGRGGGGAAHDDEGGGSGGGSGIHGGAAHDKEGPGISFERRVVVGDEMPKAGEAVRVVLSIIGKEGRIQCMRVVRGGMIAPNQSRKVASYMYKVASSINGSNGDGGGGGGGGRGSRQVKVPSFRPKGDLSFRDYEAHIADKLQRLNPTLDLRCVRISRRVQELVGETNGFAIIVSPLEAAHQIVKSYKKTTEEPHDRGLLLQIEEEAEVSSANEASGTLALRPEGSYKFEVVADADKNQSKYAEMNKNKDVQDVALGLIALPMAELSKRAHLPERDANRQIIEECLKLFQTKLNEKEHKATMSHSLQAASAGFRSQPRGDDKALIIALMEYPEKYELTCPGGKRHLHERSVDCAIRETKEETGIDLGHARCVQTFRDGYHVFELPETYHEAKTRQAIDARNLEGLQLAIDTAGGGGGGGGGGEESTIEVARRTVAEERNIDFNELLDARGAMASGSGGAVEPQPLPPPGDGDGGNGAVPRATAASANADLADELIMLVLSSLGDANGAGAADEEWRRTLRDIRRDMEAAVENGNPTFLHRLIQAELQQITLPTLVGDYRSSLTRALSTLDFSRISGVVRSAFEERRVPLPPTVREHLETALSLHFRRAWGLQAVGGVGVVRDVQGTGNTMDDLAGASLVLLEPRQQQQANAKFQLFHCSRARAILLEYCPQEAANGSLLFLPSATYIFQYPEPTSGQSLEECCALAQLRIECFAAELPKRALWEEIGMGPNQRPNNLMEAVKTNQRQAYTECLEELRTMDHIALRSQTGETITIADWCGYQMRVYHTKLDKYVASIVGTLVAPAVLTAQGIANKYAYRKRRESGGSGGGGGVGSSSGGGGGGAALGEDEDPEPNEEIDYACEAAVTEHLKKNAMECLGGEEDERKQIEAVFELLKKKKQPYSADSNLTRKVYLKELALSMGYEGSDSNAAAWLRTTKNIPKVLEKLEKRRLWVQNNADGTSEIEEEEEEDGGEPAALQGAAAAAVANDRGVNDDLVTDLTATLQSATLGD